MTSLSVPQNPPPVNGRVICAWCGVDMGPSRGGDTHGICKSCYKKYKDSLPSRQFDPATGWPIDPATGQIYTHKQIVTSGGQIPRPQDVDPDHPYWRYRSLAEYEAAEAKARKRRTRRPSRRKTTFNASSALSGFSTQEIDRGQALADLVDRFNRPSSILVTSGSSFAVVEA